MPAEIQIEHLQVEQINIEKTAYPNNIGQLGIDDRSGKLNIGTSYEGDFAKEIAAKLNNKFKQQAEGSRGPNQGYKLKKGKNAFF